MSEPLNLARMWRDMLQLCNLKPTEHVAVLTRIGWPSPYAAHAVRAAEAVAAIGACDLPLDLAFSHDARIFRSLNDRAMQTHS